MGAQITIDKHTTPIDEWFDVNDRLDSISFDEQVCSHVSLWKFFMDEVNPQQFNCLPVEIDLTSVHQLLSPHETYLLCAINNTNQTITRSNTPSLTALINSIRQNIEQPTTQTPIVEGQLDGYEYCIYAYLGKMSKTKIRLAALSYTLKMQSLLTSHKKLAILSAGGVLRSKKLQKGSTLSLLTGVPSGNRQITDYSAIHVFSFYWKAHNKVNPLLSYQSKKSSPFIACPESIPKPVNRQSGVKPPLLKLSLKPFEEVNYSEIQEQQKNGQIKFDIRTTARHELKMQKFQNDCSQILDGIFVAGDKVSKDWDLLQKHNIKAVINCAGDYCQNWFQNKGIQYLTYFLKDSQNQNIECLFYRSIEFIQNCQKNKMNVLVHCIQGISRSVTIVIAYLIFKLGYDYKKAEQLVKQKRGIACPNNGFMVELIQFHKRLYEDYSSLPTPRVFMVSSHSKETPSIITARMIKQSLFDQKKFIGLDCRAIYIVQVPDMVYVWVGSKCEEKRLQSYWSYAQEYVKKLQKYERASIKIKAISQGTEGKQFFALWNLEETPQAYENPEYTRLFSQGQNIKPGGMRKFYERQIEEQSHKKLFIYPDFNQGLGVFEYQDLGELSILVISDGESLKIYICKDDEKMFQESEIGEFLDNVIKTHYESIQPESITVDQQNVETPSDAFLKCFS